MNVAVEIADVSKRFRLYDRRRTSLKERLLHGGRGSFDDFWALRDVSLEITEGSTVGILGHNGSGKSTLLKCMAGILQPTSGEIRVRGRVAALLELGAGFNAELSGRDNIYLNASLLGMSRRYIDQKFDEIVAFAELEKFIDQQVKYYSSGMYVRLGFAVAVNVEPDVFLVDEVLAVGDENFQRKCIERVKQFQVDGRTIVVVSHGAELVRQLCNQAAVLDEGVMVAAGNTGESIKALHEHLLDRQRQIDAHDPLLNQTGADHEVEKTHDVIITSVVTDPPASGQGQHLEPGQPLELRIGYQTRGRVEDVNVWVNLHDVEGRLIFGYSTALGGVSMDALDGHGEVVFAFASVPLLEGEFRWVVGVTALSGRPVYDMREQMDCLSILNTTQQIGLLCIPTTVHVAPGAGVVVAGA